MAYSQGVAALHEVTVSEGETVAREMDRVVGDLSHLEVTGQQVLVGVFVRPGTSKSGLILGTGAQSVEDIYQGKVVRVLKVGPQAFPLEFHGEWTGETASDATGPTLPQVGDWLVCEAGAGFQISVKCPGSEKTSMFDSIQKVSSNGGWPCRLVYAADIRGRATDPSIVV